VYPNLYFLFYDLFGIEIPILKIVQSFGFFVAMAFIAASYIMSYEFKRKTKEGLLNVSYEKVLVGAKATYSELFISFLTGFIFGYKLSLLISDFGEFVNNPQEALLSLEGNWWGGLLLGGYFVFNRYRTSEKEKKDKPTYENIEIKPEQHVGNITVIAAVAGILGAKIFHLLEYPEQIATMFSSAQSFFSGLTMYGGLIFGAGGVLYYAHKKGLKLVHVLDSSSPALMLAYGIGRIGCHISGDGDWGIANPNPMPKFLSFLPDWMWSYGYPNNVNGVYGEEMGGYVGKKITEGPCFDGYCTYLDPGVYPTPFYEAIMCILLFGVLWFLRPKIKIAGILFSIYLIFNGIERFVIEQIRVNERLWGTNITQAEIIAIILIIIGIIGIYFFKKNHSSKAI
jgi:phosphatidylglycerol---prolipoprotein diacylglyceryl transferase